MDYFSNYIFKHIFLNESVGIAIQILQKFVLWGSNKNNPALVPIMAWRQLGDKPLSEPMIARLSDTYMRH